ncbi:MAG: type II toxin-antitoxin system HicA family toxin [Candidatus Bathyarchaeia archaeon]
MSLKPQPATKIIKALSKLGFKIVRKRGGHVVLKHPDGRLTVIPVHADEEISTGLLNKIIKDTGISKEEFMKFLKKT